MEQIDVKKLIIFLLLVLALLLSACGGAAATATQEAATTQGDSSESKPVNTDGQDAVSVSLEFQLLLGTLKLEGTELAITAEQATVLLPLWQQVQALSQQDMAPAQGDDGATPAAPSMNSDLQTQIDELTQQIQAAMTADQLQAITDMGITQDSAILIMQELGIDMEGNSGQPGGDQQPPQGTMPEGVGEQNPQGTPPSGDQQLPQGTPPSGNQQPPQGTMPEGDGGQPPQNGGPGGRMNFMSPQLIEALIQILEDRIASTANIPVFWQYI